MKNKKISSAFPFDSKYFEVNGSKIHYIEEGEGDPILFLHGNPTSNYLWRNIIPYLTKQGRCIAPDLIGMGDSEKLDNVGPESYRFVEHREYLDAILEALGVTVSRGVGVEGLPLLLQGPWKPTEELSLDVSTSIRLAKEEIFEWKGADEPAPPECRHCLLQWW